MLPGIWTGHQKTGILADMSIGGTLADARHRAGLSVADVSARTRIRQTLIRAIERDDFGACGGDFYARGHVRAIARVVGVDSEPLISEYDAARPGGEPTTMDDLLGGQPSVTQVSQPVRHAIGKRPPRNPRRSRHPAGLLVLLLIALGVISFGSYRIAAAVGGSPRLASAASAASQHRTTPRPRKAPASTRSSPSPSPTSTPTATAPAQTTTVTPVSAVAFGAGGTADGDNPQNASLALSGNPATPWQTDWYTTAQFGNLTTGTGLLLDLGRTETVTGLTVQLGSTPGADLQVRAGTSAAQLTTVATADDAGGTVHLSLAAPTSLRYVLLWFTLLPPDSSGTYQADVSRVTVTAAKTTT
jgi:cytoskeletal protein RodZ